MKNCLKSVFLNKMETIRNIKEMMSEHVAHTENKVENTVSRGVKSKAIDKILESKALQTVKKVCIYFGVVTFVIGELLSLIFGILALIPTSPYSERSVVAGAVLLSFFATGLSGIITAIASVIGVGLIVSIILTTVVILALELIYFMQIVYTLGIITISQRNEWAFGWYFEPLVIRNKENREVDIV